MPQRFLRPGITTSDSWNSVSFPAQSFYVRILTLVDDFGRYDGRAAILRAHCFALRDDIKAQRTAELRSELHAAGLIDVYAVEGKEIIQVTKWTERPRSARSRYPDPPHRNGAPSESASNPQDSAPEGGAPQEKDASLVPRSSVKRSSPSPDAGASREGGEGSGLSAMESTRQFVCSFFGQKKGRRLSGEAEHELSRQAAALPLTEEQAAVLTWWMRLPDDQENPFIRNRPSDADKLVMRLFGELDRAEAHQRKLGVAISSEKEPAKKPEPDGWREWYKRTYGEEAWFVLSPQNFWQLPESIRSSFELMRDR